MDQPKVLLLDIETAPNVAYVWKLYDDYISPDHLVSHSYILCVSAKWLGEKDIKFYSVWKDGQVAMLKAIHKLMDDATVIIHYNGKKFDIPTLNREFLTTGLTPPAPYKQIDLYGVVKSQFKFTSNKLDYVCQRLSLGTKVHHKGMQLWHDCINGKPKAHKLMEAYNKQDVNLLEKLYYKLRPWIIAHPIFARPATSTPFSVVVPGGSVVKYSNGKGGSSKHPKVPCPKCGGLDVRFDRAKPTKSGTTMSYKCKPCNKQFSVLGMADTVDHKPRALQCPRCGSGQSLEVGVFDNGSGQYRRFRCYECKGYFKGEYIKGSRDNVGKPL